MQPNREKVAELLKNPIVQQWIADLVKERGFGSSKAAPHANCHHCGWPHYANILCGAGATFGKVRLGSDSYYIDAGNVEYMLGFIERLGSRGFHWKDNIYFDVKENHVIVTSIWQFNNHPQMREWKIPLLEWRSITGFVQRRVQEPNNG